MATEPNNSRTHEPSLRELTAELDGMRNTFNAELREVRSVATERDRLYDSKFKAVHEAALAGLASQEKLTAAAFAASEKAIMKAEASQNAYNASHNDLLKKMEGNIPRTEYGVFVKQIEDKWLEAKNERDARLEALRKEAEKDHAQAMSEIAAVREALGRAGGKGEGSHATWLNVVTLVTTIATLLTMVGLLLHLLKV